MTATTIAALSAARYPGGTVVDRSTKGYSLSKNFLSDLGMTAAWDGQRNAIGAALFVLSLLLIVLAFGRELVAIMPLYTKHPRARRLAVGAAAATVVACLAFAAVAVTPENAVMNLHIRATLLGYRALPLLAFLFAAASFYVDELPRTVAIGWLVLGLLLVAYNAVVFWGPSAQTPDGLVVQVVAQKVFAVVALVGLTWIAGAYRTLSR